ncbi:MAG: hypothetical protein EOO60_03970 [Hymenobacter sp.]|nr:MAG: hypothetical protein EOO60_03970 [Hymenobacter sp.]
MTFHRFGLLRPRAQLLHTLVQGLFLAQRWSQEHLLKLYYLPDGARGFFVEVVFDEGLERFIVLRSFSSQVPLTEYAREVRLPF